MLTKTTEAGRYGETRRFFFATRAGRRKEAQRNLKHEDTKGTRRHKVFFKKTLKRFKDTKIYAVCLLFDWIAKCKKIGATKARRQEGAQRNLKHEGTKDTKRHKVFFKETPNR